jgi:hypothetical protein
LSHFRPVGTLISTSADHRSFRRRVRDGPLLDDAHHAQSVNFGRSGSRAKAADNNHNGPVLYRPLAVPAQVDNYSLRVAGLIPKDKRKRQARPGCSGAPWPNRYHMYRRRQPPDRERGGERTSSGSKTRLGVQGGSRARSIAASGIIADATSGRYARSTLFAQTGSKYCSPKQHRKVVLGNAEHMRLKVGSLVSVIVSSVEAGAKGVKGG